MKYFFHWEHPQQRSIDHPHTIYSKYYDATNYILTLVGGKGNTPYHSFCNNENAYYLMA